MEIYKDADKDKHKGKAKGSIVMNPYETHPSTQGDRALDPKAKYSCEMKAEIEELLKKRREHRMQKNWRLADEIYAKLRHGPLFVEIIDYAGSDRPAAWRPLPPAEPEYAVAWEELCLYRAPLCHEERIFKTRNLTCDETMNAAMPIPFIVVSVDSPLYRERCKDTLDHLHGWQLNLSKNNKLFDFQKKFLLDHEKYPKMSKKHVLFEGWRQILLPYLLGQSHFNDLKSCSLKDDEDSYFCLVAEDDVRLGDGVTPALLHDICKAAFDNNPLVDMLSFGHSWKELAASTARFHEGSAKGKTLFDFLSGVKGSAGIHGATLLAIRMTIGASRLLDALNSAASKKQQTHLDQFLFHSPRHNLSLALSDPPLAGWAEVRKTLTSTGSGYRRQGGGRLASVPSMRPENSSLGQEYVVRWVKRNLTEIARPAV